MTSLDIPSSSGIVIVDNTSSNENLVATVQVPREHPPIHHIQQQQQQQHNHQSQFQSNNSNHSDLNQNDDYSNLQSTNVIDTTNQNTLQTGVINFTTNDVLSNAQVLKFVSDDSGTILDQSNEEIQSYCATGRLITNPTSKVHVISNVPFSSNNKAHGGQQTINLVSNGKITQTGVNFVNAYYAKPGSMQGGKILNLPVKGTANSNQIQQQIINKGGNQLKVSVPRNVQFVTRTTNPITGGNIIMSRTGQNNHVIQTKGQQLLVPQNNIKTATITNNVVKNKTGTSAQLQSVKIFQGNAQSQKCTTLSNASTISGIKAIIPSQQKITSVKGNSTTVGGHKFTKQFSSVNNNYCTNTAAALNSQTFVSQHQQIQTQKGAHLSQQQANLIYTACNNSTNTSNNGSMTKVQTVQYQRAGNLNNVLIQGKGIFKGNKYVVQHNPNQTHIVLPSQSPSPGSLVAVSGTVTNVQQLKTIPHSFTANNSGTIKYVNAQGNVTQPPSKVRAIFQQHSTSTILQQNQQILDHSNDSSQSSIAIVNAQHSPSSSHMCAPSASMEDMIVNGTLMTEEMSARILQSLSQKTIFTNNRPHNQINNINNSNCHNNNKMYPNSPNSQHATKVYLTQSQEHNINTNNSNSNNSNNHQIYHISGIGHGMRDNNHPNHHHHHHEPVKPSSSEKYFKVSSCDLSSTTTTFIDNIPLTSTRGDNISHGQRGGEDDDELIGEEVRPAPMNIADGKVHLLQVIVQDHTYAAVQPEQTKKITSFQMDSAPTLSAANIQQAGLNYNFKTNNNNDDDANSAISTGSRNGGNQLDNDLGEETETAPEGEGEDDSVTRCICDLTHDDGYMICCDKCSAWQHVDCMGIDRQNIPEEYKCELCQPRPVDKQRARNLQLMKRKEQQNVLLNNQQQQQQQHMSLENNTQLLGQQMDRTNLLNKSNSLQTVGKKHKQSVKQRKAELASQFAQQKRERKLSSRSNGKRRESKKISKRKAKMNLEAPQNEKTSNLRAWIENYEQAITNHYSPELRARLHAIGKQNQIIKELIPSHLRHSLEHRCTTVPHAGGKILISTSDLAANVPIVEVRGKYMLSSQFRQQQAIPSATGNVRNHQYNRKPGPFIFFYRLPNDGPEICIDTRTYGNEARFVRRSCRPNAEILHSIEKGAIHLYIVSLSNIIGGTEITVKHEPHDLTAISRGNVTAPTSTVCACGCPKDCIFAIATANHLNNVSQKAMKKLNGHLIDETRLAYRRSKSLMARGRSTSSSGDSNASMLSPNNTTMSALTLLQPMQPITIPLMAAPTTPLSSDSSSVFSPQPLQQPQQPPVPQLQLPPPPTPIQPQQQILSPPVQIIESISMPSPSRPATLNIMPPDHLMSTSKMPNFPVDISTMIPQMGVVEKITPLQPPPAPLPSPVQSVMPVAIASPTLISQHKSFSPQKCFAQQQQQIVHHQIHKKIPNKVRQISFSEDSITPVPVATLPSVTNIIPSSPQEDSQKSCESATTPTAMQKLDKPSTKEPKEKDSPKLTREERKMQAIMKAFEKMEKNQERKQQLKQNKCSVSSTKRRNSSPSSPRYKEEGDHEKPYHPRKKKRKGSKSYQHLSNPKIRRRSRMNSGDSDLLTSEESTSLLSPPLPPGHQITYNMEDIKSPDMRCENQLDNQLNEKNVNSAAGLLLSLSHSHDSQESSATSNIILSPNNNNNNNSTQIENNNNTLLSVSNPLHLSSACLLVEAAVAPLEQTQTTSVISSPENVTETDIKFHVQKTKTKKSIMNDWLNQTDSSTNHQNDETTNLDSLVQVAATMCSNLNSPQMVTHSQIVPVTYAIQEEPHNLSMAAKKVEEFIYQNDVKMAPAEEEDVKWHHPNNNLTFSNVTNESNTTMSFVTPPGAMVQDGSGSAAKKRWLRQAISEECDNEASSPPNGYMTPLKKRRLPRQCSEVPIPEELPPSNQYIQPAFCVNDIQQIQDKNSAECQMIDDIKISPNSSFASDDQSFYPIKLENIKEEVKEEPMPQISDSVTENKCDAIVENLEMLANNNTQLGNDTRTYSIVESNPQYIVNHYPSKVELEEIYEQDDEIDIVSSPPPGEKIVAEDNLVKIEPEDENEKDEKIDVVEDVASNTLYIVHEVKEELKDCEYKMVEDVKTEAVEDKPEANDHEELNHEIGEIFGSGDKQGIEKFDSNDIKTEVSFPTVEDEETDDMEAQIEKCINAADESINDADDEAEGDEDIDESDDDHDFEHNEVNLQTVEHAKEEQISKHLAEIADEGKPEVVHEEYLEALKQGIKQEEPLEIVDLAIVNKSDASYSTEESDKSFESELPEYEGLESEVYVCPINEPNVHESDDHKPEVHNSEVLDSKGLESEVHAEILEPEVHETEVLEAEVHEAEVLEAEVYQAAVIEPDVFKPDVREAEVYESEGHESKTQFETHESEVIKSEERVQMEIDEKEGLVNPQLTPVELKVESEVEDIADVSVEDIEMECNEDSRNTSTPIPTADSDQDTDTTVPIDPEILVICEPKSPSIQQAKMSPEPDPVITHDGQVVDELESSTSVAPKIEKFEIDRVTEKPSSPIPPTSANVDFEILPADGANESEECNNVNDEIADIQKRLHSFHTENILILKSRNKKTKPHITSKSLIRSPVSRKKSLSPAKPTTPPPVMLATKTKKSVQLNFDLSVQDDMTVNVKLKDKNEVTTFTNSEEKMCSDSKREHKESKPIADTRDSSKIDISKEERHHTRWDKPDEVRYEAQPKITSSVYPYLNTSSSSNGSNNTTSTSTIYGITSLSGATNLSQLPPTIHIPPNTPASHIQYYNAFYNKYSISTTTTSTLGSNSAPIEPTENSKLKYPSFSLLSDYLDTSSTTLNNTKSTSFHTSTYSSLDPSPVSQQPTYYSSMNSNGPSLISSFLSKSYSSDQITAIQPPKLLSRAQSADPRLNPNLNVPEPPPAPKRKLSINEYRKRKQQSESSNTNNSDKSVSKSSSSSSLLNDCFSGNGGKSDSSSDIKDTLRQIDEKEKEVLFSPAPTELEMQQEILSERLKSFKSLHGLASLPPKSDDIVGLSFMSPLKDKDLESSLARSNRLSTGSNSSSTSTNSSLSSINSEIHPSSPLSSPLSISPSSHKH